MVRTDGQDGADPAQDGSEAAIPATNAEPEPGDEPGDEPEPGDGDGDEPGDEGSEGAPPVRRRRRGRRILAWTGGVLAVLLLATGGGTLWLVSNLQGNIHHLHVEDGLAPVRPPKLNQSTNILIIGSDSRAGSNGQYGNLPGARSDTTILMHLSPNADRAVAISFPRDSMVAIPACRQSNGSRTAPQFGMINAAFAEAGAVCTWRTIESLTGIHIDHFVQFDFVGFKRIVDALGGVEICLPQAINDPRANLVLPAGRQVVMGDQALGYVRERYALGDGSDLGRIKRQQKFMSSVVQKALSGDTLTDPVRTFNFLTAATKSVTTDDKLSLGVMKDLAGRLKGLVAGKVQFVTVPNHAYPQDPNRVEWDAGPARALFDAIRKDDNMPAPAPPLPVSTVPQLAPNQVKVTVLQSTKVLAAASARQIAAKGFKVGKPGTTKELTTRISYGPGAGQQAAALAALLPGVNPIADPKAAKGTIHLVVGQGGLVFAPPQPVVPPVTGATSANQNLCGSNS